MVNRNWLGISTEVINYSPREFESSDTTKEQRGVSKKRKFGNCETPNLHHFFKETLRCYTLVSASTKLIDGKFSLRRRCGDFLAADRHAVGEGECLYTLRRKKKMTSLTVGKETHKMGTEKGTPITAAKSRPGLVFFSACQSR
jgi:hypothetical protein